MRYRMSDEGKIPKCMGLMKTNENGFQANITYVEYNKYNKINNDINKVF
jgi:hypothetical protein